jgi:hypothetical protein
LLDVEFGITGEQSSDRRKDNSHQCGAAVAAVYFMDFAANCTAKSLKQFDKFDTMEWKKVAPRPKEYMLV